jgi:hypothetical protein
MRAPNATAIGAGSAASGANSFAGANSAVASNAPYVAVGDAAHGTATMRDPTPITSFDLKRIRGAHLFYVSVSLRLRVKTTSRRSEREFQ